MRWENKRIRFTYQLGVGDAGKEQLVGETFNVTYDVDDNGEPIPSTTKETSISSNETRMHLKNFVNFQNGLNFRFDKELRGLQTRLSMFHTRNDDFE